MATEHTDKVYKQGYDCVSYINERETTDKTFVWYYGVIVTPNGMVHIPYSEPSETKMRFFHSGRVYTRCWPRQFQPRYLTNLARKFAEDVTEANR